MSSSTGHDAERPARNRSTLSSDVGSRVQRPRRPRAAKSIVLLRVTSRRNAGATRFATAADFETHFVKSVARARDIPEWTTYLAYVHDFERRELVYTSSGEPPAYGSTFLYMSQRDSAANVVRVPFSSLAQLGDAGGMTPTFVLSPGRCGSTMLFRMLRAIGKKAVSEPDTFTSYTLARGYTRKWPAMQRSTLIRASVESLRHGLGDAPVIKLRGVCCLAIHEFIAALPGARSVVLLREREAWARSQARAFGFDARAMALILRAAVLAYDRLMKMGNAPMLCWYEELCSDPLPALSAIAGRAVGPRRELSEARQQDAQEGSPLARPKLSDASVTDAQLVLFERAWQELKPTRALERLGLQQRLG